VLPKTTGTHQLSLLVQGVNGNEREDLDPEVEQYEVAFNLPYWLWTGIQQNGIGWLWTVILMLATSRVTLWWSRRHPDGKNPPSPPPTAPEAPKRRQSRR
jgi:hypothetical protein